MATDSLLEHCRGLVVDTHDVANDVVSAIAKALNDTVRPAVLAVKTHAARALKDPDAYAEVDDTAEVHLWCALVPKLNALMTEGRDVSIPVGFAGLVWPHVDISLDMITATETLTFVSGTRVFRKNVPKGFEVRFTAKSARGVRIRKEHFVQWKRTFPMVDARPVGK